MRTEQHGGHDNREVTEPVASRPRFPSGYGIHVDDAGLVPWTEAEGKLDAARNYWIGTTRPDGSPHAMPVWGLWLDGSLYFSSGSASRKTRNLAVDPRIVVHLESGDDVVVLEGVARRVTDDAELLRVAELYTAKYDFEFDPSSPDYPVFRVTPRRAYAWLERDYPGTATRYAFT
jgi:PPOX class probable F420-dependent enzyme